MGESKYVPTAGAHDMTAEGKGKPPPSVIALVVIFSASMALFTIMTILGTVVAIADDDASVLGGVLVALVIALLTGLVAGGMWRGYRPARIVAMVLGALSLPGGILVLVLVTRPAAKEWFGLSATTIVHFPRSG